LIDGLECRYLNENGHRDQGIKSIGTNVFEGDERERTLMVLSNFLLPGRVGHAREPNRVEIRQTAVWRLSLDGATAKIRTGPPKEDPASDYDLPFWGGVMPVRTAFGEPESDRAGVTLEVPDYIRNCA